MRLSRNAGQYPTTARRRSRSVVVADFARSLYKQGADETVYSAAMGEVLVVRGLVGKRRNEYSLETVVVGAS